MAANRKQSRKRAADDEWKQSERARQALVAANHALEVATAALAALTTPLPITPEFRQTLMANLAQAGPVITSGTEMRELPVLPDDCWLTIMQLATGQRLMSTFGPNGKVQGGSPYYGAPSLQANSKQPLFASLHTLRLVSRAWCRMASRLVREFTIKGGGKKVRYPANLAQTFPYAEIIWKQSTSESYDKFINDLVTDIDANHHRRNPNAIGMIRVRDLRSPTGWFRNVIDSKGEGRMHITVDIVVHPVQASYVSVAGGYSWAHVGAVLSKYTNLRALHILSAHSNIVPQDLARTLSAVDPAIRERVQIHQFAYHDNQFLNRLSTLQQWFARPFILHCTATSLPAIQRSVPPEHKWTILGDEVLYNHLHRIHMLEPVP